VFPAGLCDALGEARPTADPTPRLVRRMLAKVQSKRAAPGLSLLYILEPPLTN